MNTEKEISFLANEIKELLIIIEARFFDVFVGPYEYGDDLVVQDMDHQMYKEDNETYIYRHIKLLYLKINLFLELKNVPKYLDAFKAKFAEIVEDKVKALKSYHGLYNDSEPSLVVIDDLRQYLEVFYDFDKVKLKKLENNKLKLILENTNAIFSKLGTKPKSESAIYNSVKWVIEIVYPSTRLTNKASFIQKEWTYHPDILIPEISSAIEYKYVRKGKSIETFLTQIKTDADNYKGDSTYRFFYAVIVYEDKNDLHVAALNQAIYEKDFPENWIIIAI